MCLITSDSFDAEESLTRLSVSLSPFSVDEAISYSTMSSSPISVVFSDASESRSSFKGSVSVESSQITGRRCE